ncbi:hypothetical protein [Agrobacterium rosae]|uniref:Uncharacterized protein n=1 Tax=Agrobacterium rosae TaxID=1972867 RepID=A0A1R3TJW2_9HYPH|nr:hypothetical protein [Agrobacterium rosae]SCX19758.1 hypothetical protein DSM25559_1890 [Agrobacterium rosae]
MKVISDVQTITDHFVRTYELEPTFIRGLGNIYRLVPKNRRDRERYRASSHQEMEALGAVALKSKVDTNGNFHLRRFTRINLDPTRVYSPFYSPDYYIKLTESVVLELTVLEHLSAIDNTKPIDEIEAFYCPSEYEMYDDVKSVVKTIRFFYPTIIDSHNLGSRTDRSDSEFILMIEGLVSNEMASLLMHFSKGAEIRSITPVPSQNKTMLYLSGDSYLTTQSELSRWKRDQEAGYY